MSYCTMDLVTVTATNFPLIYQRLPGYQQYVSFMHVKILHFDINSVIKFEYISNEAIKQ